MLEVSKNKIALWKNVHLDNWTTESVIIASNDYIIGRYFKHEIKVFSFYTASIKLICLVLINVIYTLTLSQALSQPWVRSDAAGGGGDSCMVMGPEGD